MRINGLRRKAGMGTAGMYESVMEAAKNGFSSPGRNALNVEVLGPVPTNSKDARCFGIFQLVRPFQTLSRVLT